MSEDIRSTEVSHMTKGSPALEITSTELKRCDLVKVSGRMDRNLAPRAEEVLKPITDQGRLRM
jgi:hypothetical protein